jgi:hypothetical protein
MTRSEHEQVDAIILELELKIEEACEIVTRYREELDELGECLDEVYAMNQDPEIDAIIKRYVNTPNKGQMQ